MSKLKEYTSGNRKSWNQAMHYHRKADGNYWFEAFKDIAFTAQKEPELSMLKEVGIEGKHILQPSCNKAVELLSLSRLGAASLTGVDISDEAIKLAQEIANSAAIDASLLAMDVYDLPAGMENQFDLVYLTIGALVWLPNLSLLFQHLADVTKSGGKLFIYEQHPICEMLPWDDEKEIEPGKIVRPYFNDEVEIGTGGIDYLGGATYKAEPNYEFAHTLGKILSSIASAGFCLESFTEYDNDISTMQKRHNGKGIPLSYILIARKL